MLRQNAPSTAKCGEDSYGAGVPWRCTRHSCRRPAEGCPSHPLDTMAAISAPRHPSDTTAAISTHQTPRQPFLSIRHHGSHFYPSDTAAAISTHQTPRSPFLANGVTHNFHFLLSTLLLLSDSLISVNCFYY